jgi:hypothetical protein
MTESTELTVRTGTLADLEEVMELAIMASDENGFLEASPARLVSEIYPALMQDHGICGLIGQSGGIIEGVVLLRIGPMWYSDPSNLVVEEKAIFTHPDYRDAKGGRARKLCEFSKKVADDLGIPLVIGVLSHERTRSKVKMYERVFGEPAGAFFLYGVKTGEFSRTQH